MKNIVLLLLLGISWKGHSQLRLPAVFTDNMVLQQQKPIRIWGWAPVKKPVFVDFANKRYRAFPDADGSWMVTTDALLAGRVGDLVVTSGEEQVKLSNILAGEVWMCSGQSNMEFTMQMFGEHYAAEINNSKNDDIRFITIQKTISSVPNRDVTVDGPWRAAGPTTTGSCSAVAYWYGKYLYEQLHVPIGLIVNAWSGSPAQAWVGYEGLYDFNNYSAVYEERVQQLDLGHIDELVKSRQRDFELQLKNTRSLLTQALAADFDDTQWPVMEMAQPWEKQGLAQTDGVMLCRMPFELERNMAGKAATLHLPPIDDSDSTYINGVFIGADRKWDAPRTYAVPKGVLKAGRNVLSIRVQDDGGGGGMSNFPDQFNLIVGAKTIPLNGQCHYKIMAEIASLTGGNGPLEHLPGVIYNGMVAPVCPYVFRGVIWYQGETNAASPIEYRTLLPALITDWRHRWGLGDFPFLLVQLSSFGRLAEQPQQKSNWALLREAQSRALDLPQTGMAVTTDIGDAEDIHPKWKKEVGFRLAARAMDMIYGYKNPESVGPVYRKFTTVKNKIIIEFDHAESGLMAREGPLQSFAIAGADQHFVWADAQIVGKTVEVSSHLVDHPVAVRYAWSDSPLDANLYNQSGFPASPFRTDAFPNPNPVIAHRGAWKKHCLPENSLASLREAIRLGCAGSEFDVRMTLDDSLVICHDPTYFGLSIEKTRFAELRQHMLSNGEKLPTLREYLKAGMQNNPSTLLICEIKSSELSKERSVEIAAWVATLVQDLKEKDRVHFISFEYEILKKLKSILPNAKTQYLSGDKDPNQLALDGISGLDYHFSVYKSHPDWVALAKEKGLELNAWTVNDKAEMRNLLDQKFEAITTNEPELLLELYEVMGMTKK